MVIKKLKHKKIIALLIVGIILITGFLLYREEATNKEAPKKAHFVLDILSRNEIYG